MCFNVAQPNVDKPLRNNARLRCTNNNVEFQSNRLTLDLIGNEAGKGKVVFINT